MPDGAVHATRREDCAARPYTARGQVRWGAVHGTGGQAHGGAVQRTIGWCVVGQRTEHVGKRMTELCMERRVRIPRLGRTQTGGNVHCGVHTSGGYAHGGTMHGRGLDARRRAVHGMCGEPGAVQRARGWCAAGPHTEPTGKRTAEPCTERAETLTEGLCNGQEGRVWRARTRNRLASARQKIAWNEA